MKRCKRVFIKFLVVCTLLNSFPMVALATQSEIEEPVEVFVTNPNFKVDVSSVVTAVEQVESKVDAVSKSVEVLSKNSEIIIDKLGTKSAAAVTEVYSINNNIATAYYKPESDEIYNLEEIVLSKGFANAYTGFFDLDWTEPYTGGAESRALEILGYDFLLANESYDGKVYNAEKINSGISYQTAIMDIYKALGLEIQEVACYYSASTKENLINSPAIKNLSWIVNDLDVSRGRTEVFVTRTNPSYYVEKAKRELHLSDDTTSAHNTITSGEFIVLLKAMMELYGEPVISDGEMNQLLQVYGVEIPNYLTNPQKYAYMYLRARGIIVDNTIDFTTALTLEQMLDMLMRVQDVDSRATLKEIQVTMDISDELVAAGYFPRTAGITYGSDAIQIKQEIYGEVTYYDYYIRKVDTGFTSDNIYVPLDVYNLSDSQSISGVVNYGVELIDGIEYYHLQINPVSPNSEYFSRNAAYIGIDGQWLLLAENGNNKVVAIQQGGGKYTYDKQGSNIIYTIRDTTSDGNVLIASADNNSLWSKIKSLFEPVTVKANPADGNTRIKLTIYNVSNIDTSAYESVEEWAMSYNQVMALAEFDKANDSMQVVLPKNYVSQFIASIKRTSDSISKHPAITALSTIEGDSLLVSYRELVDLGIIYDTKEVLSAEMYDNSILVLDTKYGRVTLNNGSRCIVVGTNTYRCSGSNVLWTPDIVNNDLLIDFRAIYGWTGNIVNTVVTGDGDSYTVNIEPISDSTQYSYLSENTIRMVNIFESGSSVSVVPELVVDFQYNDFMMYAEKNTEDLTATCEFLKKDSNYIEPKVMVMVDKLDNKESALKSM